MVSTYSACIYMYTVMYESLNPVPSNSHSTEDSNCLCMTFWPNTKTWLDTSEQVLTLPHTHTDQTGRRYLSLLVSNAWWDPSVGTCIVNWKDPRHPRQSRKIKWHSYRGWWPAKGTFCASSWAHLVICPDTYALPSGTYLDWIFLM